MRRAGSVVVRAAAALRRGYPAEASASARAALDSVGHAAWGVAVGVPMAALVRAALAMGDLDGAAFYLNRAVPAAMFETPFALPYLQTAAAYHLAVGDPQTALSGFRLCGEMAARWQLDVSELVDWRTGAVAALLGLGREDEARELLREQLSLLGDRPSRARDLALYRLATMKEGTDRLSPPEAAIALPPDTSPSTPAAPVSPAAPVPRPRPIPRPRPVPRAEAARAARAPLVAEAEEGGVAGLTDAERRVAALAAAGATNREIAGRLFITVSTVEQHLTKIYRKLNVRRRSALPAELLRHLR
jgi:DNA-binding CsgD family transcriptional regulator